MNLEQKQREESPKISKNYRELLANYTIQELIRELESLERIQYDVNRESRQMLMAKIYLVSSLIRCKKSQEQVQSVLDGTHSFLRVIK